jgi:hypothetical protein
MKYFILTILSISTTMCFSQLKFKVVKTKEKDENHQIDSLNNIIKSLKIDTAKYLKENKELKIDLTNSNSTIKTLNTNIKNVNEVFLKSLFTDKYTNNSTYFKTTDLSTTDDRWKIEKWDLLLKSIEKTTINKDTLVIIKKALDFNMNYSKLFEIKTNILSKKYDLFSTSNAISEIEKLPKLDEEWKLNETKIKIKNLLLNYESNSCLLKEYLDKLKEKDQNTVQPTYTKYEKNELFADYKYLVNIIRDMKRDVNSYTIEDLSCDIVKKEEKINNKIETEVKNENTKNKK